MDDAARTIAAIVTSIVGLALVAVIFSSRANTAGVIQSGGAALAGVIGAAVAPVTGGSSISFSSPSASSGTNIGGLLNLSSAIPGSATGGLNLGNIGGLLGGGGGTGGFVDSGAFDTGLSAIGGGGGLAGDLGGVVDAGAILA